MQTLPAEDFRRFVEQDGFAEQFEAVNTGVREVLPVVDSLVRRAEEQHT